MARRRGHVLEKHQCEQCPARNRVVRPYEVEGKAMNLCQGCVKAAIRIDLKIRNV